MTGAVQMHLNVHNLGKNIKIEFKDKVHSRDNNCPESRILFIYYPND